MSGRYPQTFIDDLSRQADIVRILQDYIKLTKRGSNWKACCPFHAEKTPSFDVSPSKSAFYCFGCHKGGSVFSFVMEIERVSFPEAVKIVAEKMGVPLPVVDSRTEAQEQARDTVIRLNTWAMEWWESQLAQNAGALSYLEHRGINQETRTLFRLGYAPDSWDALSIHLRRQGASTGEIEQSGLVVTKEGGGHYDRFRNRLMFVVMDARGRPVAFSGRAMSENDPAKYINSPETSAYVKGRNLFGMNLSRDDIRRADHAILVEGNFDLITPFQFGVRNVVASLGTALTPDQAKLLGRFTRKVVINYDGDAAGLQAAKKALEILIAEQMDVTVVVLPGGADPDGFIRKSGVGEYHAQLAQAKPHIHFLIDESLRGRNLSKPADKSAAVNEVLPFVKIVPDKLQRREYFDIAMDCLHVSDQSLRGELWKGLHNQQGSSQPAPARPAANRVTQAEQRLLELLVGDEELRFAVLPIINREGFEGLLTAPLFRAISELEEDDEPMSFDSLRRKVQDEGACVDLVPTLFMAPPGGSREEADRCLNALRVISIDHKSEDLERSLAAAERRGDASAIDDLSMQIVGLARQKRKILDERKTRVKRASL